MDDNLSELLERIRALLEEKNKRIYKYPYGEMISGDFKELEELMNGYPPDIKDKVLHFLKRNNILKPSIIIKNNDGDKLFAVLEIDE